MRVTNSMMVNTFLRNYNSNMSQMDSLQEKLTTGKKVNRPSDDPVGVVRSLRLTSSLGETNKFVDNVNSASSWIETNDTALGQAGDLLNRVRELTINGANDSLPQTSRDALAQEVSQLKQQLLQVANTTYDGRYIFGGFQTTTRPFDPITYNYSGDLAANIDYEIGINAKMTINITGNNIFKAPVDIFQVLTDIQNDLTAGNTTNLSTARLGEVDQTINNILELRADIGAKTNRLEMTKSRLEDTQLNLNNLLSQNEDINQAEVITQLQMQQNVYKTALAAGAKIIQPSLMDYLR